MTIEESAATHPRRSQNAQATGVIGPIAVVAALLSALTTLLVLSDLTFINPTSTVVVTMLAVNFVTVVVLLALIGREVWHIAQARCRGNAGARMRVKILALFWVIAVVPVAAAVVASINLDRGFDRQFVISSHGMVENAVVVSNAYLEEHRLSIRSAANLMAIDLARTKPLFDQDFDKFRQSFTAQAVGHNVAAAMMLRSDGSVIVKADIRLPPELPEPPLPPVDNRKMIGETEAAAGMAGETNYVGALIKLKGYDDAYLFVAHILDPAVWAWIQQTRNNIKDYTTLEARRSSMKLGYALMYTVIAFAVLLSAVWIGFAFANQLRAPIDGDADFGLAG
jgi:two-component system, NtrC family, nitrogen regulation sensor histidine kinase NtrY